MSSLFGAAAYGYVFKGDKSLEFREWIENPLNKDDYFKYRLNEGHSWNKGKLCIDYESNVTFSLMQIEHKVLLISSKRSLTIGDSRNPDEITRLKIENDFDNMLRDCRTPKVFKNKRDWKFVGTFPL